MSTTKKLDVIGHARRRVDGREKVTGQLRYADDMKLPRMLHMKLLRSPHPHALIESIDTSRALAYPGVHLVLTGKDFPVTFGIMPVAQDEYPLAPEHVRYVGDPVAAVVAKDEQTAAEALDLIDVKYKSLPTIATPEEALAHPEARIHDYTDAGNIHRNQAFEFGDVEEALAKSDHVFEDLFFYEGDNHMAMEQHAALAKAEGDGKLTIWSSTQDPHYLHRQLARVLQMSAAHIRVIACDNGGGFGGKCDPAGHEFVVSKAALMLGRPVKICLTREEVFYLHRGRHPVLMKFRTGVTKDGKLTGMHLQTLLDGGAYGSHGPASTFYTGVLTPLTYELPRFKFDACRVFTNKPACGPKRGHGTPQPRFGQEIQLDKIAEKLKIDPADLRLNMVTKPNSLTASWLKIGSNGLAECIRQVVEGSGWRQKHGKLPEGRGVGIACSSYMTGAGVSIYWNKMPHTGVQLSLDRSGQVTVFCGATEVGQGSDDVLAAVVAETLGISTKEVRCVTGDTGITPIDLGSYSSRVTMMMGNAALQAAGRARDMLVTAAAEQLEVLPESIVLSPVARPRIRGGRRREEHELRRGRGLCRNQVRHSGHSRLLHAAQAAGQVQGCGCGPVAGVFLLRLRGRGGSRRAYRLDHRTEDLDRARHRPCVESGARPRAGHRRDLHGSGRGLDGRAGVPPAAAQALQRAGAQDSVAAGIQEHHLARHARGRGVPDRGPGSELPLRRQGSRPGAALAGDAGGRQRRIRRRRRAHRRSADHAGKDSARAAPEARRQGPARGAGAFPRGALYRTDVRYSAGRRRRRH